AHRGAGARPRPAHAVLAGQGSGAVRLALVVARALRGAPAALVPRGRRLQPAGAQRALSRARDVSARRSRGAGAGEVSGARRARAPGEVTLERALSKLGVCSRSDARALVLAGRVLVDGRPVRDPLHAVVPERARVAV